MSSTGASTTTSRPSTLNERIAEIAHLMFPRRHNIRTETYHKGNRFYAMVVSDVADDEPAISDSTIILHGVKTFPTVQHALSDILQIVYEKMNACPMDVQNAAIRRILAYSELESSDTESSIGPDFPQSSDIGDDGTVPHRVDSVMDSPKQGTTQDSEPPILRNRAVPVTNELGPSDFEGGITWTQRIDMGNSYRLPGAVIELSPPWRPKQPSRDNLPTRYVSPAERMAEMLAPDRGSPAMEKTWHIQHRRVRALGHVNGRGERLREQFWQECDEHCVCQQCFREFLSNN